MTLTTASTRTCATRHPRDEGVGVETGGSNVQFAVDPQTGAILIVEMNPRVSRSLGARQQGDGFPIAKIAAQLAVGLTLDEITNDITKKTRPASSRPSTTSW
jgi:carbamoyl-phosphate synthase large subunit